MPPTATETEEETETQTLSPGETQTAEGEDLNADEGDEAEDSAGTDDEEDGTDGDDSEEGADDEAGVEARREAWKAAQREALREELRAELQAERKEQTREQTLDEVKQAYPNALIEARDAAKAVQWYDAEGELQTGLPKAAVDAILAPFDKYNLKAWQGAERLVHADIIETLESFIPKADLPAFHTANNEKELTDWVADTIERGALRSKAFKGIETVDQLLEHASPKLKADIADRELSKDREGFKKGLKAPGGEPRIDGKASRSLTWAELQRGYGQGTLSDAQEQEYERQRAARAKAS